MSTTDKPTLDESTTTELTDAEFAARTQPRGRGRFTVSERYLPLLAAVVLLALWMLSYTATRFVPSPLAVVRELPSFLVEAEIVGSILASGQRVLIGLVMALVASILTVAAMMANRRLNIVMETYVFIALGIPSAAAALFALMIFGLSELGVYVAVAVITYPFITIGIKDGAATVEDRLLEMGQVYRLKFRARLRHVIIPHIAPYLLASVRNAHALGWKIAIVAEVFMARDGIGGQFQLAFDHFNIEEVLLWLGVFLVTLFVIEYGVLRTWERHIYRWRPVKADTRAPAGGQT